MKPSKKKPSGRNIPEGERHTVQVKLRLPPETARELDDFAARCGVNRSSAVLVLLDIARRAMMR